MTLWGVDGWAPLGNCMSLSLWRESINLLWIKSLSHPSISSFNNNDDLILETLIPSLDLHSLVCLQMNEKKKFFLLLVSFGSQRMLGMGAHLDDGERMGGSNGAKGEWEGDEVSLAHNLRSYAATSSLISLPLGFGPAAPCQFDSAAGASPAFYYYCMAASRSASAAFAGFSLIQAVVE